MNTEIEGYLSAQEAAEKLGYNYEHFTRVLKAGRVPGAKYWHGWLIPAGVEVVKEPGGRKAKKGYVYLVEGNGWYKIGRTASPEMRMEWFKLHLPFPVSIVHLIECADCASTERMLHNRYRERRINGEWFDLTPEDVREIKTIKTPQK